MYTQIFELCYYSNGGFSHNEVYFMPTPHRKFFYNLLLKTKKEEESKNNKKNKNTSVKMPNIKK